ncbi:MAG: ABC transporter ATP-binding protein [Candidatus Hodarchaeales archaeon]
MRKMSVTKEEESLTPEYEESEEILLSVRNLVKYFPITAGVLSRVVGYVHAVDNVSFDLPKGKTVGVVGESGCGKTTLGRTILRLTEPTSGDIIFQGENISEISRRKFRHYRRQMQIVFQDPYASLNPRMMIKNILREPLLIHKTIPKNKINPYILAILREVGLDKEHLNRFPHEFSGGQRQRICIARALVLNPNFIVLDEPTASVDVSVQARVLNLLKRLQKKRGLTYMFISHDLSVVTHMSDIVIVMYLGQIMEIGPKKIFTMTGKDVHPYTLALGSALPIPDPFYNKEQIILKGDVPNPANPPSGCVFHTRCPEAQPICSEKKPPMVMKDEFHYIACHFR